MEYTIKLSSAIMLKLVVLILVCISSSRGQTSDYCSSSLCSGKKHIACAHDGSFSSTCTAGRSIISVEPYKSLILQKHNAYRNQIASGELPGYKPAVRMGTMEWDDELAALATLNVKQCVMKHDECRNTERFKYSGQNLAWRWAVPPPTAKVAITNGINNWFEEYKDASQANIDKYTRVSAVIGHFTVMVNDRNTRVGCGIVRQPKEDGAEFFFGCNYAQTNIRNRPIYISGPAASKCTKGKNKQYPALCSTSEPINPNTLYKTVK